MARPVNYIFCQYRISVDSDLLTQVAEFNLLSENQGQEVNHGREKNGAQPHVLCTEPERIEFDGLIANSFDIGYKPGIRVTQEYDANTKQVNHEFAFDRHTKLGQIVTVPERGLMAVRDHGGDDKIPALPTINAFRTFIQAMTDGEGSLDVTFATDDDVEYALDTWDLKEYKYTARPLNPTGSELSKMRSEMYRSENIGEERGIVKAKTGESLTVADGTLGQTHALAQDGYAQFGIKGYTEDGNSASIPKPAFSQDKQKNLKIREEKPRYLRVAFDQDDVQNGNMVIGIARSLVVFYSR